MDKDLTDLGVNYSYCSLPGRPNSTNLQHQQIKTSDKENMFYHCLNRLDENPFKRYNKSSISPQDKWWNNVNTPCEGGKGWRRCLGEYSDACVLATGNKS